MQGELTRGDELYADSDSDALRVSLGENQLLAEHHHAAISNLEALLAVRHFSYLTGLTQLRFLISLKSSTSYGTKRAAPNTQRLIMTKAERFASWVNGVGKQLKLEGWTNADR